MFDTAVMNDAIAHARAAYPKESCGAVIAGAYVPFENKAANGGAEFVIDDSAFDAALQLGEVEAVIHSHPTNSNWVDAPSLADMQAQLAMNIPWGIIPTYSNEASGEPYFWGRGVPTAPLIGRQFRHGVHDCYTLIRDYYAVEHGIVLSNYAYQDEWWEKGQDLYRAHFAAEGFVPVVDANDWRAGDLCLAQIRSPITNHAAIYMGDGLILHHLNGRSSRREPGDPWLKFMTHHLRHETLA